MNRFVTDLVYRKNWSFGHLLTGYDFFYGRPFTCNLRSRLGRDTSKTNGGQRTKRQPGSNSCPIFNALTPPQSDSLFQWLSPEGCGLFSMQLHIGVATHLGRTVSMIQHLLATAIVNAILSQNGYEVGQFTIFFCFYCRSQKYS